MSWAPGRWGGGIGKEEGGRKGKGEFRWGQVGTTGEGEAGVGKGEPLFRWGKGKGKVWGGDQQREWNNVCSNPGNWGSGIKGKVKIGAVCGKGWGWGNCGAVVGWEGRIERVGVGRGRCGRLGSDLGNGEGKGGIGEWEGWQGGCCVKGNMSTSASPVPTKVLCKGGK